MPDCSSIDPLVTPFVDGVLPPEEQADVARHIDACAECRGRVVAERSVRSLLQARRADLAASDSPASLKDRCDALRARPRAEVRSFPAGWSRAGASAVAAPGLRARLAPFALAASLLLIVGGAFLYQATRSSSRVLAAELTADHVKCFRLNDILGTSHSPGTVEASMASTFGWNMHVPEVGDDVQLVGSRFCLYGEGGTAHIMFKHHGEPMSLFMLPREARGDEVVGLFGHQSRIWSAGDRTFVLVSREHAPDVDRVASLVRASIR